MLIVKSLVAIASLLLLSNAGFGQRPPDEARVSVMVVADFHMANPGHDIHNVAVDDVLAPGRQAEIAKITDLLADFHPNVVMAEWPADLATARYRDYLTGILAPDRNEVVQLGFRLAKTVGLKQVL